MMHQGHMMDPDILRPLLTLCQKTQNLNLTCHSNGDFFVFHNHLYKISFSRLIDFRLNLIIVLSKISLYEREKNLLLGPSQYQLDDQVDYFYEAQSYLHPN